MFFSIFFARCINKQNRTQHTHHENITISLGVSEFCLVVGDLLQGERATVSSTTSHGHSCVQVYKVVVFVELENIVTFGSQQQSLVLGSSHTSAFVMFDLIRS